eukprot:m.357407 g.357407  ORF g.357407 m.357407 type:complete len:817 (-) comp16615_c0_seq7:330-2780(-)
MVVLLLNRKRQGTTVNRRGLLTLPTVFPQRQLSNPVDPPASPPFAPTPDVDVVLPFVPLTSPPPAPPVRSLTGSPCENASTPLPAPSISAADTGSDDPGDAPSAPAFDNLIDFSIVSQDSSPDPDADVSVLDTALYSEFDDVNFPEGRPGPTASCTHTTSPQRVGPARRLAAVISRFVAGRRRQRALVSHPLYIKSDPELQRYFRRFLAAVTVASILRPDPPSAPPSPDFSAPSFADTLTQARTATDELTFGSAGFQLNFHIPSSIAAGFSIMAGAQSSLSWKKSLAPESPHRDKVLAALNTELTTLQDKALTRVHEDHPDYDLAVAQATPGRLLLNQKRCGKFKARGVVRGDLQDKEALDGADFSYFAAASSAQSLKALLFRGSRCADTVVGKVDIRGAFLQSQPFGDDVPPRFLYFVHPVTKARMYFKQRCVVYGEAAAPAVWQATLVSHLTALGFVRGKNDTTAWFNADSDVSLVVHTDDIIFSGKRAGVDRFLHELGQRLDLQDPEFVEPGGDPVDILGLLVAMDADRTIYVSMQGYIEKALEVLDFTDLTPVSTPFDTAIEGGEPLSKSQRRHFLAGVGALNWITGARPDVSFASSRISQHSTAPTTAALRALRRAFAYLKGTSDLALSQAWDVDPVWSFYTDSDYGSNGEDGNRLRPQLGVYASCGGTPVMYFSKVSKVAFATDQISGAHADCSVAASEVYALGNGTCDFLGLSYAVEELGLPPISRPFNVYVDNTTAEVFAKGTVRRSKLKHIDQRQFWVCQLRDDTVFRVCHVPTADNPADIFTKALTRVPFERHRDRMLVKPPFGVF